MLDSPAAKKVLRLEREIAQDLPQIRCDRTRVVQVLANLIGNAVKFAPASSAIRVCAQARPGDVLFAVTDAGPGISEDQRPFLFDRYWKGRPAERQGVGLGLYIAKGIVEAHGGHIWVESRPGAGSTFYFTIPRDMPGA